MQGLGGGGRWAAAMPTAETRGGALGHGVWQSVGGGGGAEGGCRCPWAYPMSRGNAGSWGVLGGEGASRDRGGEGDNQRCIGRGGGTPPPPSRAPSLRPATVPLTPSASLNGMCNRQ